MSRSFKMLGAGIAVAIVLMSVQGGFAKDKEKDKDDEASDSRIRQGFLIAPVQLDFNRRNRALVGLGSYLVNSGGCNDCHTNPPFLAGGNPFLGQPTVVNAAGYLAGGQAFGPFISRNLTPKPDTGLPAGLTFEQFLHTIRTGQDLDNAPPHVPSAANDLLQVMPWVAFRNLTDHDLRAIYEYLSAIPSQHGYPE